jgi:hypothetical protein
MPTYPVLQERLALAVKERQARTWKEVRGERTCNSESEFAVSFFHQRCVFTRSIIAISRRVN